MTTTAQPESDLDNQLLTDAQEQAEQEAKALIQSELQDQLSTMSSAIMDTLKLQMQNMISTLVKELRKIPLFDKAFIEFENKAPGIMNNKNVLIALLIVFLIVTFLTPMWILVSTNLILTIILVYKSQSKCINK
jgi:hypothetical protein